MMVMDVLMTVIMAVRAIVVNAACPLVRCLRRAQLLTSSARQADFVWARERLRNSLCCP